MPITGFAHKYFFKKYQVTATDHDRKQTKNKCFFPDQTFKYILKIL